MKYFFLSVFFVVFFCTPAFADGFSDSGDSSQSNFYNTISYVIDRGELPMITEGENSLSYEQGSIYGKEFPLIGNEVFSIFFYNGYWRENGVNEGTYVSAPPGGTVKVVYQYWNNAGHQVDIPEIILAYSRNNLDPSYFKYFADFTFGEPLSTALPIYFGGTSYLRSGILRLYNGVGVIGNGEYGFKILDEVKLRQPIHIKSIDTEEFEDGVKISVRVKNESNDELNNLVIKQGDCSEDFSLTQFEEKELTCILQKELEAGVETDLGFIQIQNNATVRRCSVVGSNFSPTFEPNSISTFSFRDDGGWVNGASIGPSQESFCIERIPYTLSSSKIVFTKREGNEQNEISEVETPTIEESQVLGSNTAEFELPKTGFFAWNILLGSVVLLVLDVFLWYSVLRKRKYEESNIFAKLCTKSRKNPSKGRL